jgi:hypothetical protein
MSYLVCVIFIHPDVKLRGQIFFFFGNSMIEGGEI